MNGEVFFENDKIKNSDELKKHLIKNKFEWLRDGKYSVGFQEYKPDGTVVASFNEHVGIWTAIDSKTLWFMSDSVEYTIKFNCFGEEGVLIKPVRDPPSKVRMVKADK